MSDYDYDDEEREPSPFDSITKEIVDWAYAQLNEYTKELDYVDNYRIADIGNPEQLEIYEKIRESGCCGEGEFNAVGPDGKTYLLGFNHGH